MPTQNSQTPYKRWYQIRRKCQFWRSLSPSLPYEHQVLNCQPPLRRCQGRYFHQPQKLLSQRTRANHSPIRDPPRQEKFFGSRRRRPGSRSWNWWTRNDLDEVHLPTILWPHRHQLRRCHHRKIQATRRRLRQKRINWFGCLLLHTTTSWRRLDRQKARCRKGNQRKEFHRSGFR